MLARITSAVSAQSLNIENLSNGSKGEYSYTIIETSTPIPTVVADSVGAFDNVIKVRIV